MKTKRFTYYRSDIRVGQIYVSMNMMYNDIPLFFIITSTGLPYIKYKWFSKNSGPIGNEEILESHHIYNYRLLSKKETNKLKTKLL